MRRAASLALLLSLAAACAACGGTPDVGPDTDERGPVCREKDAAAPDEPVTLLGRSAIDAPFEALADGARLKLEHGIQGGQHVWVAARFYSPDPGRTWTHRLSLEDALGRNAGGSTTNTESCAPGWTLNDRLRVFVESEDLLEADLVLRTSVTDSDESTGLMDRKHVMIEVSE